MEDSTASLPELPEEGLSASPPSDTGQDLSGIGGVKPKPKRKPPVKRAAPKRTVIVPKAAPIFAAKPAPTPKAPKTSPPPPVPSPAVHLHWYWKVAATLAVLSAALLVFVLYLIFAKATITVVPKRQQVAASFKAAVSPKAGQPGTILGVYKKTSIEATRSVAIQGDGKQVEGVATGRATLINTTDASQTLVATTRLLTADGVLFRLKNQSTIPARGRVEAEVYADKPGAAGNIGPSKFTIPGLKESLQDAIYAASTVPMKGGVRSVKVVTQADIDSAMKSVEAAVREEALAKLRALAGDAAGRGGEVVKATFSKKQTAAAVGTEASLVSIDIAATVEAVFYDRAAVEELARNKLIQTIPADEDLTNFDTAALAIEFAGGADDGSATISVSGVGVAVIKPESTAFDKTNLAGLSKARVIEYFRTIPAVESVEVKFRPFWVRRVPGAKDHIEIIISQ